MHTPEPTIVPIPSREAQRAQTNVHAFLHCFPEPIVVHHDGIVLDANEAFLGMHGAVLQDVVGRSVGDLCPPQERETIVQRCLDAQAGVPVPVKEVRTTLPSGMVISVEALVVPVVYDGRPCALTLLRDISERRKLIAQAMQMDRLVAVGTLAAGVGHEINNPLALVTANLDFMNEELPRIATQLGDSVPSSVRMQLEEMQEVLRDAREGARRVRDIVRDLRIFSRRDNSDCKERVDLPRLLDASINMAWNEIRHRAKLVKDFGHTPPVEGGEAHLGQVFLNILINAAQAIPEGGAERNRITVRSYRDGSRVCVEIRDTGCGISPENLPHIFDPFFTTKPVGQGTGLGLAICQSTVQRMGGSIEVESSVGSGTVFRIRLIPMGAAVEAVDPHASQAATPGIARVLVIDDEPALTVAVRRLLVPENAVEVVHSGREALEKFAAGERYDVILCDLMMPDVTGMDVHAQVARDFPELLERMVMVTGGAFTPRARSFLESVPNPRMEKPFEPNALRALVRQMNRRA
jgi:PAS domain S-box-containing protein